MDVSDRSAPSLSTITSVNSIQITTVTMTILRSMANVSTTVWVLSKVISGLHHPRLSLSTTQLRTYQRLVCTTSPNSAVTSPASLVLKEHWFIRRLMPTITSLYITSVFTQLMVMYTKLRVMNTVSLRLSSTVMTGSSGRTVLLSLTIPNTPLNPLM